MSAKAPILFDGRGNRIVTVPRNRYEGAFNPPNRSWLPGALQSANRDINRWTRRELARKARYFYRNSPTIRALIEKLVIITIGTGLHPTPKSTNTAFNKAARRVWRSWCKRADLQTRISFETLQSIVARSAFLDGDIGILKTFGPSGRPRVQLIESHLITDGRMKIDQPDGVQLDEFGRPASYSFALDDLATSYEPIPADDLAMCFIPERAAQYRGVSLLAAALNTAHDMDDILRLEKDAVKIASSKVDIIKTPSGDLDQDDDGIGASIRTDGDEVERVEYYKEVVGAETKVLRPGDEYTPYIPKRPSPTWQGFMDFMADTTCLAAGVAPSIIRGTRSGSNDNRRDLASTQRTIEFWQGIFASCFQQVYEYVIQSESEAGYEPELRTLPADWRETEWVGPAKLTVDAGRESQADREDVKAGLLTMEEYYARYGQNWEEQIEQRGREARKRKEVAEANGVAPGEIAMLDPNELSALKEGQDTDGENEGPSEADQMAVVLNAYGIGVRAGGITPQRDDEDALRQMTGLPAMSADAKRAWDEENGVRRPITLQGADGGSALQNPQPEEAADAQA